MSELFNNRPKIIAKKIVVKEIKGDDELVLERGERVLDTKIIGEMMTLPRGNTAQYAMPEYKTVVVIERTEYDS